MKRRHHFIGDVHGMSEALHELIAKLALDADDVVVFLGEVERLAGGSRSRVPP